jgi:hypothetical protein
MGLIHDGSIASANEFCERIGSLPMPSPIYSEKLFSMGAPNALVTIENSAQNGRWEIPDKKIMI